MSKFTIGCDRPSEGFFKDLVTRLDAALGAERAENIVGPDPSPPLAYTPCDHGEVNTADLAKGLDKLEPRIPEDGFPPNPVKGGKKW